MFENFSKCKILVIGDVMLDTYLYGNVGRISPEAPVPIINIKRESFVLGGAANVANNVAKLKAKSTLIGLIGDDDNAILLKNLLKEENIDSKLFPFLSKTITKTRIVSGNQQLLRIDFEDSFSFNEIDEKKFIEVAKEEIAKNDIVLISDYAKGVCNYNVCKEIIKETKKQKKFVIIDPKKKDWERYEGATLITPNLKELSEFIGESIPNIDREVEKALKEAYSKISVDYLLVTRSEKGMTLYDGKKFYNFPTEAREVYDVSGAGDTVIATLSVAIASGMSLEEAVYTANKAAGVVVAKAGTAPIYYDELIRVFEKQKLNKLLSLDELLIVLDDLKKKGKRIVFTNGCFDILHRGHISYLFEAKRLGDVLVIGLNSDFSVKRLKGETRPINNEFDRALLLSALEMVDYIVLFNEDTPYEILSKIKPDILVKGGDYKPEQVVGREFAKETIILNFIDGYSTTSIINKAGGIK
ncbi:MAG: bifunctional D-glycero-beta-D-manno-heptose-7-phosphate kinase/D-glycero-beta-D-manno-heptose 1-phosphate adenylyltransferase HldE [Brevinematales bacterium]|nr:bifunctional D-glycero-beta-D-manno-heptose-7-phosphate kinase/D-glycero-beta-D-manno-heptose 1-phosphate adenylyltransferase HldE [Brevinematales bacterium]